MKIKSIAAICKKNKNIAIFERYSDDGDILTQYIGDGSAVYPVIGLPPLDAESLLTIFDVPEKDRDNYFVKTLGVPAGISFEDTDATERHVEREGISIIYSGRTLKPIHTTRGLVFIESRYLSPAADVLDVLELYERRTTEGTPYIVAKAGFLLQAVIMPYDVINQQFVESLQDLTRECEFSLSEKERRERESERNRRTLRRLRFCKRNRLKERVKAMTINEFAAEVHKNAVEHGWWEGERTFPEIVALIHSEVSEALEEYRDGKPLLYFPCNAGGVCCEEDGSAHCGSRPYDPENPNARCSAQSKKPEGIAAELADVIIRVLDYCAYAGIDIENVLEVKHEYNKSRPYRHGGKKC